MAAWEGDLEHGPVAKINLDDPVVVFQAPTAHGRRLGSTMVRRELERLAGQEA